MRDIKFRVWDSKNNIMSFMDEDGYYRFFQDDERVSSDQSIGDVIMGHFPELILLEYTGLKDLNGKDIYEGDWVSHFEGEGVGFIKYDCCSFLIEWVGLDCYSDLLGWYNFKRGIASKPEDYSIVGNIYENPELIPK